MSTPAHFTMKLQPGALASARRLLRGAPKRFPQHRVHLGIHETEGSEPKTKYDGTAGELNLATVAMFHEFLIGRGSGRGLTRTSPGSAAKCSPR